MGGAFTHRLGVFNPAAAPDSGLTWANVAFLMRPDLEANASTDYQDSGPSAFSVTKTTSAGWGPRTATATKKYNDTSLNGTAASYSNGRRFWLTSNLSGTGLDLGTSDWTMSAWVNFASTASTMWLWGRWNASAGNRSYAVRRTSAGDLELLLSADGSATITKIQYAWTPTTSQWYHLAFDYDGTTYRAYIDGVMVASATGSVTLSDSTTTTLPFAGMCLATNSGTSDYFDGHMEDLLICRQALYATDTSFTLPTEPTPIQVTSFAAPETTTSTSPSSSAFATKGTIYTSKGDYTIDSVDIYLGPTGSEDYKLVIAEVNGSDVIQSILGSSASATYSTSGYKTFTPTSTVNITDGMRFAVLTVRTDGTSTSVARVPFAAAQPFVKVATHAASARFASVDPQVSDSINYDFTSVTRQILRVTGAY